MMPHTFLLPSLVFPRLTLLTWALLWGIPTNPTPFLLDVLMVIFAPRLLIGYWAYTSGQQEFATVFVTVWALIVAVGRLKTARSADA